MAYPWTRSGMLHRTGCRPPAAAVARSRWEFNRPRGLLFLPCFWAYFTGSAVESFARVSDTALMAFELCGRKAQ